MLMTEHDVDEVIDLGSLAIEGRNEHERHVFVRGTSGSVVGRPPRGPAPMPPTAPPPSDVMSRVQMERLRIAARRQSSAARMAGGMPPLPGQPQQQGNRGMVHSSRHDDDDDDDDDELAYSGFGAPQPQQQAFSTPKAPMNRRYQSGSSMDGASDDDLDEDENGDLKFMKIKSTPMQDRRGHGAGSVSTSLSSLPEDETRMINVSESSRKDFVTGPCPRHRRHLECYVRRDKGSKFGGSTKYYLYLQEGDQFLLAAKKRGVKKAAHYVLSVQEDDIGRDSEGYVGKVRSNFTGTQFHIYDDGINPKDAKKAKEDDAHSDDESEAGDKDRKDKEKEQIRCEFASILYEQNILGRRGPRKMTVIVPRVNTSGNVELKPSGEAGKNEVTLYDRYEKGWDRESLALLRNKSPQWNEHLQAYVLNFGGRVTQASVKNFQLVSPSNENDLLLQFGRVDKDLFTLDFKYPILPIQAFGIAISSLDSKLFCE